MSKDAILSNYSPSLVEPDCLEAILVQREHLIESFAKSLSSLTLDSQKKHLLFIGPPGIGKSFTISLIVSRLITRGILSQTFWILRLGEESWGITSYLDLLSKIVQALPNVDSSVLQEAAELSYRDSNLAEQFLEEQIEREARKAVVLIVCEAMDEICFAIGKQGHKKLRALIQNNGSLVVITSARESFPAIAGYASPFYGFFEIVRLKAFTPRESSELLKKLALLHSNLQLKEFLETPKALARILAIHQLCGGNPRVISLFYQVLSTMPVNSVISPLLKLLDDLTPLYQSQMLQLSPQQRKLVEALADSSGPITVKALAQRVFITQQSASSQLRDLKQKQIVRSASFGRESYYEISEPLFKFSIQLKSNRAAFVEEFLNFVEAWYSRKDIEGHIFDTLRAQNSQLFKKSGTYLRNRPLGEEKVLSAQSLSISFRENHDELCRMARTLTSVDDIGTLMQSGKNAEALSLLRSLTSNNDPDEVTELLKLQATLESELGYLTDCLSSIRKLGDINEQSPLLAALYANTLGRLGHFDEAIKAFEVALTKDPDLTDALTGLAQTLFITERYEDAEKYARKAIQIHPTNAAANMVLGQVCISLNRIEEAGALVSSFENTGELSSDLALVKSRLLELLGKNQTAIEVLDHFLCQNLSASVRSLFLVRKAQLKSMHGIEAFRLLREAIALEPESAINWRLLAESLMDAGKFRFAMRACERGLAVNPKDYLLLWAKAICLAESGSTELALEEFLKIRKIRPSIELDLNIATALVELSRFDESIKLIQGLEADWQNHPGCVQLLAVSLHRLGRDEESLALLQNSSPMITDSDESRLLRATLLFNLRQFGPAVDLLRLNKVESITSTLLLVDSLCALGKHLDAITALEKFYAVSRDHELLKRKAQILFYLRDFSSSVAILEQFLQIENSDYEANMLLALCLLGLRTYGKAKEVIDAISDELDKEFSDELFFYIEEIADSVHFEELSTFFKDEVQTSKRANIFAGSFALVLLKLDKVFECLRILDSEFKQIAANQLLLLVQFVLEKEDSTTQARLTELIKVFKKHSSLSYLGALVLEIALDKLEGNSDVQFVDKILAAFSNRPGNIEAEFERPIAFCRIISEYLKTGEEKVFAQLPAEEFQLIRERLSKRSVQPYITDAF